MEQEPAPPASGPLPADLPVPLAAEPEEFELVAASLRADAGDMATFVAVLAGKLEAALPGRVQVERHGKKLFSHDKVVTRITIDLGEVRYSLVPGAGGDLDCGRAKSVRGIVLKTDRLGLPDWIQSLAKDLAAQARTSEQARLALERLLT
ncbi:MAG TPA: hypothetical protein VHA57_13260 [Actinomycetota bacterium]|nr:hypothetical protein [Actinomycetota bacterium]